VAGVDWTDGYALDVKTTGATFLGHYEYGHPRFDTVRSPLGDLVYRPLTRTRSKL